MTTAAWQDYLGRLRRDGLAQLPLLAPLWSVGQIVLTPQAPPLALDRWGNAYFNPAYLQQLRAQGPPASVHLQLQAYWVRALGHLWCEHATRAKVLHADPWLWQLAAELALGSAAWPGFELPTAQLWPRSNAFGLPPDHDVEYYYRELQKRAVRPILTEEGAKFGQYLLWDGGSAVHGRSRPWELPPHHTEAAAHPSWDLAMASEQLRNSIIRYPQAPPAWWRWAKRRTSKTTDWRHQLRQQVQRELQHVRGERLDYSYQRPPRRPWGDGQLLLPSLRVGMQPRLAIVLDTSASMSAPFLEQALAEVLALLLALRTPLVLIPCDQRAYAAIQLDTPARLLTSHLPTGGGTDLRAGIHAALALRPPPELLLVLTDGQTPWPAERPPVPLVAGLLVTPGQANPRLSAPEWLRIIEIKV
jgi:predicted metal-dependent peptidase